MFSALLALSPGWNRGAYVFYTLCGLSDLIDGPVARKTGSAGRTGALLDSAADGLFLLVALGKLLPEWAERFPPWAAPAAVVIAAVRLGAYGAGVLRHRKFTALHTASNRLAGGILFCVPYFLRSRYLNGLCLAACIVAGLSAAEELLIQLRAASPDPDVKGIWALGRR